MKQILFLTYNFQMDENLNNVDGHNFSSQTFRFTEINKIGVGIINRGGQG